MNKQYQNHQRAISGQFFLMESRLKNLSRKAHKKIQCWKTTSDFAINENYQQQIENLLQHSFFNTVSNKFVLRNESVEGSFQKENLN